MASAERSVPEVPVIDDPEPLDPRLLEAVGAAVAAAQADPADGATYGRLGRLYHAHKYYALARRCYEIARRLEPDRADWPYYLGLFAAERGRGDDAIRSLRTALRLAPGYLPSHLRLGNALLASGRLEEADRAYAELVARAPGEPWGYLGRGKVARRANRIAEAAALLEQAVARSPEDREGAYLLAMTYRELGRRESADRQLENLDGKIRSWPEDPLMELIRQGRTDLQSLVEIANRLLGEGNAAGAVALLETVVTHDPAHFDALFNLGVLYGQQGRFEEALSSLERAIAGRPESAEAHFALAMAYASLERFEPAGAELETVLRLDPTHEEAKRLVSGQ